MTVDTTRIMNKAKLDMQVLTPINEGTAPQEADSCTSNKCQLVARIPANQGIMIMMHEPDAESNPQFGDPKTSCNCLKIEQQIDSNLADMHPNIYVPSGLMKYPDHIVKYGGGGSGVTVFGGYHPQLGSLVMKHGGHKDLLELVSLYKIERELLVRGKSNLGLLHKSYSKDSGDEQESKKCKSTFKVPDVIQKMRGHSIISRVGSLFRSRKGGSMPDLAFSFSNSLSSSMGTIPQSASAEGLSTMHKQKRQQCPKFVDNDDYQARVQAIEIAMEDMKNRIPSFRMIYISPMHLRERRAELINNSFRSSSLNSLNHSFVGFDEIVDAYAMEESGENINTSLQKHGRAILLYGSTKADYSSIRTHKRQVGICFGGSYRILNGERTSAEHHICPSDDESNDNDGYSALLAFTNQLYHHMQFNNWKITLAQQTIGESAPTASYLLAKGLLHGAMLDKLLDEEIRVIRNLQLLTLPDEVDVLDGVRLEYESIKARSKSTKSEEDRPTAADVSDTANAFVGKAIHKNFHPETGRFVLLKQFGIDLREKMVHLKPEEITPARHLEKILNDCFDRTDQKKVKSFRHSSLEDTFDLMDLNGTPDEADSLKGNPLYIHGLNQWQSLLELALSMKNPNTMSRIWTCGLTDGGLHNLFLGEDQIWMFDLGEPQLETIPAFLTKFLMSFFHTLGMEEDEQGDWVVRFVQGSGKLGLTEETKELLLKVHEAFNITMDRLIKELFDGDEEVRMLLLRYVMTQLVSDAAFCIEKWRIKGGGDKERSDHQHFLEKWLWRSLWDLYVCEDIRRKYMSRHYMKRQNEFRSAGASVLGDVNEYEDEYD